GIRAGGLDLGREGGRPAAVEAARPGRAGVVAHALVQARLAPDQLDSAQVVAEDVRVVDAGVECDRAGLLHVPPGRDGDAIAAADVRLDHQAWRADGAVV